MFLEPVRDEIMRTANCNCFATTATLLLAFSAVTFRPAFLAAQEHGEIKAADTSSPRDTLKSFIDACNELSDIIHREKFFNRTDSEHSAVGLRILDCIDMSKLPAFAR